MFRHWHWTWICHIHRIQWCCHIICNCGCCIALAFNVSQCLLKKLFFLVYNVCIRNFCFFMLQSWGIIATIKHTFSDKNGMVKMFDILWLGLYIVSCANKTVLYNIPFSCTSSEYPGTVVLVTSRVHVAGWCKIFHILIVQCISCSCTGMIRCIVAVCAW